MLPVLLRLVVTFSLDLSNESHYFFSWPRAIEILIMRWWLRVFDLCAQGREDKDGKVVVEPSSLVRSWLRVKFITDVPFFMVCPPILKR